LNKFGKDTEAAVFKPMKDELNKFGKDTEAAVFKPMKD
mgnify:CR=1